MSAERVTVAVVQGEVAPDLASALARTAQGLREARAAGATLVGFLGSDERDGGPRPLDSVRRLEARKVSRMSTLAGVAAAGLGAFLLAVGIYYCGYSGDLT